MSGMESRVPKIDQDLCTGCGVCVSICPDRIIDLDSSDKALVKGETCMQCGHCYAVCPVEAVVVPFLEPPISLHSVEVNESGLRDEPLSPLALIELMKRRRSCRLYQDRPVDRVVLDDLLRAAVTAPSGTNSQGWKFVVLNSRDQVVELGEVTAGFYRRLNRKAANPVVRALLNLIGNPALSNYYDNYFDTVEEALKGWDRSREDRLFHGAPAAILGPVAIQPPCQCACVAMDLVPADVEPFFVGQTIGHQCHLSVKRRRPRAPSTRADPRSSAGFSER